MGLRLVREDATPSDEAAGLFRLLVSSVRDYAIFVLDPSGHILTWNPGAERFKGYTAAEAIGCHFSMFYGAEDIAAGKPQEELEVATREGRVEDEGWRYRKDGSRFWANVIITALRDENGTLVGFAKVTRDLTERRRAEERAIEDARRVATAELANRAKTEFLAAMSHELRTPLNAIGGYTELLALGLRGPVTDEQRQDLERIRQSQQQLLAIINDLLNFSRIEAGQLVYRRDAVPAVEVLDRVSAMIEPQAAAKGIAFVREPCESDVVALADRTRVEQIILNLLSNAVKFTPAGGRIAVGCVASGDRVMFSVRDTGVGVPAEKREAIFEPFVQLGRSLSSAHEGVGLGLAISRDLARAMGGDLTIESATGVGSTFTVALPAAGSATVDRQP